MIRSEITLSMIQNLKPETMRHLVDVFGSAEAVLTATKEELSTRAELSDETAEKIIFSSVEGRVDDELRFIEKYNLRVLTPQKDDYPENLRNNCFDAPYLLYVKGNIRFNEYPDKWIAVVGTRKATAYGIKSCENIIKQIAEKYPETVIVSGLAYGIDVTAHRAALKYGLKTVAVVAQGLDKLFPSGHRNVAREIISRGGALVTEFPTCTPTEKYHFLQRNRIVAGISNVVIVAESPAKGGALVTADIADSYSREVFAFPGRNDDKTFEGTNRLIKNNKARLLQDVSDIAFQMNWSAPSEDPVLDLFMSEEEQRILSCFEQCSQPTIDFIAETLDIPVFKAASYLTIMEIKGIIKSLPGKMYIKI